MTFFKLRQGNSKACVKKYHSGYTRNYVLLTNIHKYTIIYMYICHVFKEDDIRVNYLPCTYYIKLILAGSVDKCTVYVFFATWTQNV